MVAWKRYQKYLSKRRRKPKATKDAKSPGMDVKPKEPKSQGNIYDVFIKRKFSQMLVFIGFSSIAQIRNPLSR